MHLSCKTVKRKTSPSRLQRNIKERVRRMEMRDLLAKLAPLILPNPSKLSGPEVLDQATSYVKQLRRRVKELKRRKKKQSNTKTSISSRKTVLDIKMRDTVLEVNLITGLHKNFMTQEIILVLQEGRAQVINLTYHNAGDSIFYTIRAQAFSVRIGMEISTIEENLKELVY